MTFHPRPTFLRSLILENPSALGDHFGPADVLRIEEEFPDLFDEPVEHHHHQNESSKQITKSKPLHKPPAAVPFSTLTKAKQGNVKSTTTTMKNPTTTTIRKDPFERLSQHTLKTSHCTRDRCKPKLDLKPSSSFQTRPVSNLTNNTKSKYSSLSERVLSNSMNNSSHDQTVSLDSFEYEHDDRRRRINPENTTRVVRVTNNKNNKVSTSSSHIPEKLSNKISHNVKLPNLLSSSTSTNIATSSIPRKRIVSSPTKTIPNTSIAFSTPPTTPRFKPVSERHNVQASKSVGFLKPVPILVKKKRNQTGNNKSLKTPSPTVKFLDKNGYEISTNKTHISNSYDHHHRPHERIQSQSDTVVGGMSSNNNNNFTLSALKKLVEVRFGHYLQPPNINNNNQNQNESEQNIDQQQQQQQPNDVYNNNNNNNNPLERDLNSSELSDILEGIENENTESFSSLFTLTSLGDENKEEEGEQKNELLVSIPSGYNNNYYNFNTISNVKPGRIINIKSQSLQQSQSLTKDEQEEYLTNASVDRCEQLLLAKLLASKYEKDGKFRKSQTPSPRKTTTSKLLSQPPPPPLHSQLLDSFEKYNKAFELAVKENPDLLQKIAHELIHAEVKKIMEEEQDNKFKYPKTTTTTTINGRNDKVISMDPHQRYTGITKQEKIKVQTRKTDINEEMKSKYTFTSEYPKYKDASINVNVFKDVESKDEDKISFEIPTPDLTPPIEQGKFYKILSQDQIETKKSKTKTNNKINFTNGNKRMSSSTSSSNSSLSPVKTPTLSKMESLVHQIQCLEFSVQNKQQEKMKLKQPLDMTDYDCSELEDFVVSSEPLVREKDVIDDDDDNNKPHRIIHDIIEECITNIPTPELTTPTISEHSRAGEKDNNNIVSIPQNHHQQQIVASSSQEKRDEGKKAMKIVKDIIKIDLNLKTKKEPISSTILQPNKQLIHHQATDEIPCSSTAIINNNKEEGDNDDLFYDYTKEKEMLEEIISQSQSQDDIKRRGLIKNNKKQKNKDGIDFETSEFSDSSLTSILELISDGELILNFNEEKSPGEVSLSGATYPYYNISPGIHQRIECPTTTTTSEVYDSSTFNAIGIDSILSQSSGLVNE